MQDNNIDNFYELVKKNLAIGLIVKNYKEMCRLFNEKIKSGNSKILQLKNWQRYFTWINDKQKIIIKNIHNKPLPKIDLRHDGNNKGNRKDYKQFNISTNNDDDLKKGVYKIISDNNIYIGSTNNNFRERFIMHMSKNNPLKHTYNMIHNGGVFEAIWIAEEDIEESVIRKKEKEYIEYYIGLSEWNVINLRYGYKIKYSNIKIKKNDYNTVISLLQDNNIYYKVN